MLQWESLSLFGEPPFFTGCWHELATNSIYPSRLGADCMGLRFIMKPHIFYVGGWYLVSYLGSLGDIPFPERAEILNRWRLASLFANRLNEANGKGYRTIKLEGLL